MGFELSVVIPVFNEEKRLPDTLNSVCRFLMRKKWKCEIIIVNDGSGDNSVEVAEEILDKGEIKYTIINNLKNKGKGYAVKKGVLVAQYKFILFMDADNSTHIQEMEKFLPEVRTNTDVFIGSRYKKSKTSQIFQPTGRHLFGLAANLLIRIILLPGIKDSQCGFKMFSKSVTGDVFLKQTLNHWGFDFEILAIAKYKGYKILEIPVSWQHAEGGNIRFGRAFLTLFDLFKVRWYLLIGRYK